MARARARPVDFRIATMRGAPSGSAMNPFSPPAGTGLTMPKLDRQTPAATPPGKGKGNRTECPDGLHGQVSTPVLKENCVYGVCANGGLRCPDAAPGGKKTDCGTTFLVPQGDRFVPFNDPSDLILAALTPAGTKRSTGPAPRSPCRPPAAGTPPRVHRRSPATTRNWFASRWLPPGVE
jgi:hypothetical protein